MTFTIHQLVVHINESFYSSFSCSHGHPLPTYLHCQNKLHRVNVNIYTLSKIKYFYNSMQGSRWCSGEVLYKVCLIYKVLCNIGGIWMNSLNTTSKLVYMLGNMELFVLVYEYMTLNFQVRAIASFPYCIGLYEGVKQPIKQTIKIIKQTIITQRYC